MLCAGAGLLLMHTGTICSNANMQSAYHLVWQGGARLLGSAPPAPAHALSACSTWQPVMMVLAYAAIGRYLYVSELGQRRTFLARALAGVRHQQGRAGRGGEGWEPAAAAGAQQHRQQQQVGERRRRQQQQEQAPPCTSAAAGEPAAEVLQQLLLHQGFANSAANYWLSFALPGICCLRSITILADMWCQ